MIKISFRDVKASENIKFWISPEGMFYSWPCVGMMSQPHHEQKIKEISKGEFIHFEDAHSGGWVSGGNINDNLYIRPYNLETCIENLRNIPKRYLFAEDLTIETETDGQIDLKTFAQSPIIALMRYIRDGE